MEVRGRIVEGPEATRAVDGDRIRALLVPYSLTLEDRVDSGFRERFESGSVTVVRPCVVATNEPGSVTPALLADTADMTARLDTDLEGLWIEVDAPDNELAVDLADRMADGERVEVGYAFEAREDDWDYSDALSGPVRSITSARVVLAFIITPTAAGGW